MKKIMIKLSNPIKLTYGNPLNLGDGECRGVIKNNMVLNLLKVGAVTPCVPKKQPKLLTAKAKQSTANSSTAIVLNIKGVGSKNLADINKIYKNKDELISALKEDKVSLRDDVVLSLKKFFKI